MLTPDKDLITKFTRDRRRKIRHHRSGRAGRLSARAAQPLAGPLAADPAPRLHRTGVGDPETRERDPHRDRAAGRQYRIGRRASCIERRDHSLAQPHDRDPRDRSGHQHAHGRGRRHARARARSRGRSRPALSAASPLRGHLHHRRQSLDQCRRHRCDRAWRRARACARPRSGAGGRPRAQQSQQAEEGQYRLRPEEPVHRRRRHARHHHRGGAAAGAAPAFGRACVSRRAVGAGRGRSARPRL